MGAVHARMTLSTRPRPLTTAAPLAWAAAAAISLAVGGCAAPVDTQDESESETTEHALGSQALLADALGGGDFRCAQQGSNYNNRGDIVVQLAPAVRSSSGWTSSAKLTGTMSRYAYAATEAAFSLRTSPSSELAGGRSINTGDIGRGYYCGGRAAAYNCGPDRTDAARLFVQNGELRCEVTMTRDEVWQDNVTYKVTSRATRLSTCFDESFYIANNADVASAVAQGAFRSGRHHFDAAGKREGRAGCACEFDEAYYLGANADVAAAVVSGAFASGRHHFARTGAAEGRRGCPAR